MMLPKFSFAKAEEVVKECERRKLQLQMASLADKEIEVDERFAVELEEELEAELNMEKKGEDTSKEIVKKRARVKATAKTPKKAAENVESTKVSRPSSPIKENVVIHPEVKFFEEPIIPKEDPIYFGNILIPSFLVDKEEVQKKKKGNTKAKKVVNSPSQPKSLKIKMIICTLQTLKSFQNWIYIWLI